MNLNYAFMLEDIPTVLSALPLTLALTLISMVLALLLAGLMGAVRLKRIPVLSQIIVVFNTFIKGVPLVVQLLLCYYGIPLFLKSMDGFLGYTFDPKNQSYFAFACVAFAFNYGAYMTDMVMTAYEGVDPGQFEAAESVGMTRSQAMTRIILPQMIVIALPNIANYFMWLFKATSLASIVNVFEILSVARASTADNYAILEGYLVAAGIYWVICIVVEHLLNYLNNKLVSHKKSGNSCAEKSQILEQGESGDRDSRTLQSVLR
ncbi:MAG: amino acid ABC transporter permease [Eubacteriales bacterium]|jgi:L-cystine transport system permease protein